jgi:hypothetical protein
MCGRDGRKTLPDSKLLRNLLHTRYPEDLTDVCCLTSTYSVQIDSGGTNTNLCGMLSSESIRKLLFKFRGIVFAAIYAEKDQLYFHIRSLALEAGRIVLSGVWLEC